MFLGYLGALGWKSPLRALFAKLGVNEATSFDCGSDGCLRTRRQRGKPETRHRLTGRSVRIGHQIRASVTSTLETALEGPRELGMETESFVGQVGWFLVLGFTVGNLERDAE